MELLDQLDDVIPGASNLMAHGIESSMEEMTRRISIGNLNPLLAIALMMDEMIEESAGAAEKIMKATQ
jgi:phage tail tape-measure protein